MRSGTSDWQRSTVTSRAGRPGPARPVVGAARRRATHVGPAQPSPAQRRPGPVRSGPPSAQPAVSLASALPGLGQSRDRGPPLETPPRTAKRVDRGPRRRPGGVRRDRPRCPLRHTGRLAAGPRPGQGPLGSRRLGLADGRFVAFVQDEPSPSPPSAGPYDPYAPVERISNVIVVRDLQTGDLRLAWRARGAPGAPRGSSLWPAISPSGGWLCLTEVIWTPDGSGGTTSEEHMLVVERAGASAPAVDVIVRRGYFDRPNGFDPNAPDAYTAFDSDGCDVADDGTVTFNTARPLVSEDRDALDDVYVVRPGVGPVLVSRATGLAGADADDRSTASAISADGRVVAFSSRATNLSDEDLDPTADIFVRVLPVGVTAWVSRADGPGGGPGAPGDPAPRGSYGPALSDDGRLVAFSSFRQGLDPAAPATSGVQQVYLRDLVLGRTALVSRSISREGSPIAADAGSDAAALSGEGRFVAFRSFANGLDADSVDGRYNPDVFVRDMLTGRTALVSRAPGVFGAVESLFHLGGSVARGGRVVVFSSWTVGTDLFGQPAQGSDVYAREPLGPDGVLAADLPGPPRLDGLSVSGMPSSARVAAARRTKPKLAFRASEYAKTLLTIERVRRGRRPAVVSKMTAVGREGANRLSLAKLIRGRRLQGGERLRIVATDLGRRTTTRLLRLR